MSTFHRFWKFVLKKKIWFIAGAVVIVGGSAFAALGGSKTVETFYVNRADLVRTVKISGKVVPREKVDLGFEVGGTVVSVGKNVGDSVTRGEALVRLDAGALSADVKKAEAELASAQAELNKVEGTQVFENDVTSAKRKVAQAIRDAYTAATDAVQNKADQAFVNPRTTNPQIAGSFQGANGLLDSVNKGRVSIGYVLSDWQKLISTLGADSYSTEQLSLSKKYLAETSNFISDVSAAVNMFEATSYMSQSTIDQYKADLLSARQSLNTASSGFITAEGGLASSLSDVPVQLAQVEAAEANLMNLRYQLGKTALISPISGVVSKQEAKIGQAISAGSVITSVISPDYIVEAYIPEVSIAGVRVGNLGRVTFDAYGSEESLQVEVSHIDPAETIKDGVSTYKVELRFPQPDERIRSGLTANVAIETFRKPSVLLIPERAVVREGEGAYVYVKDPGGTNLKLPVSLGERDSQGNIELVDGLSGGESIIVNPEEAQ